MGSGGKRAALVAFVLAAAAAACGLFPDVSLLEGNDAATSQDGTLFEASGSDVGSDSPSATDASDASTASDASDAGDATLDSQAPACPSAAGPTMLHVDPHTCIDSTEVTVAQYRAFWLAVDAGAPSQPAECAWNTTSTPLGGVPGSSKDSYPIANLNWCQAYAYCAWAGKALCGTPDGGAVPFASFTSSSASVWMNACSAGGAQIYPYGATFDAGACNLAFADASAPMAPVATFPGCVGSLPGLYDMVGNVKEWENSCSPATAGDASLDLCRRRGAGVDDVGNNANKTCSWDETDTRNHQSYTSGVRCCAYLP